MFSPKSLAKAVGAVCLALALSGCVIAPCCGGGYHHPYWGWR